LLKALQDPVSYVGMTAASALGRLGARGQAAVPALIELLESPASEVQLLRNAAAALGGIGHAARPALPALRRVQHLRVKYIAEEAIAKIEGRPIPTWH
jgi:HEAT repeat protein